MVLVDAKGEGGRLLDSEPTRLTLVETDGTWDIVGVVTPGRAELTSVAPTSDGLEVSGTGIGFEGTGVLTTTSYCDPELSTTDIVRLGPFDEPESFTEVVEPVDCDVVIVQLIDSPGADGATPAIASLAVRPGETP